MPNPITRKQFDAVRCLQHPDPLREKLTDKQVSQRSGVSESTVRNIRAGKLRRPAAEVKPAKPRMHDGVPFVIIEPYKCPGCRNEVTLSPCLICHERAKRGERF